MALIKGPILGTTAFNDANIQQLKDAGVRALRCGLPWPWKDGVGGELNPSWEKNVARLTSLKQEGFTIVGGTPILGSMTRVEQADGTMATQWNEKLPKWMGKLGTEEFNANYAACCQFYGEKLKDIVPMYQILNELDLEIFAGPLNPRQACELVEAAAGGLREGHPDACLGINSAGTPKSYYLYGRLYEGDLLDYCGVDGYRGTWEAGAPGDWQELVEELHAITQRPVFVNEWGYSSLGEKMTPEEAVGEPWPCEVKKWRFDWGDGHNPETQGHYVAEAMRAFARCGDKFLGCLFYRWEDQPNCWQCGVPECPAETAWGLVDQDGKPKPGYYAFKEGAELIRKSYG